jgi:hydrogenase maturation protease
MSDDGIGVRAVQAIQERFLCSPEVTLLDGGTLGLDLLPKLEGVDRLLVVDAVDTGAEPGSLVRLTGGEIPIAMATKLSPHQMGLKDLLTVAELVGHLPGEMVLWGVQPENLDMDMSLSPRVAASLDALIAVIIKELEQWGASVSPDPSSSPDWSLTIRDSSRA